MPAVLPDLSFPIPGVPGAAYRAFDRNGLVVVVPDRLTLEAEPDGTPRFLLTLIRSGGVAATTGGRLELGLSIESDLEGIGRALAAQGMPATLVVADLEEGGVLTINALLGPLVPTPLAPPQVLPPDLLTRARVAVQLDADASVIASRVIEEATLPVNATMRVVFRAVAPRVPLAATYNPRAVAELLASRLGEGAVISAEDFESAVDALLADPAIVVEGDLGAIDVDLRARTVALRMRDRFAARSASDPGKLKLISPDGVPSGRERIDFAEPAAVFIEQSISLDPLSAARSMAHGGIDTLVRRIEVPPVPTGRQRIALSANLPEPIAGLQLLIADFRAPASLPFRPLAVFESVALGEPDRRGEAELRLSPGERVEGEVRLRALVARNGEVAEVIGPWRAVQGSAALLGPGDFGAPLLVLRASRALTALAVVEVVAGGTVVARLDAATPMMAVPLTEQTHRIFAKPLEGGLEIEVELGGKKRVDLDVATLPGFGVHRARLTTATTTPFLVEWRPDGDEGQAPLSVRMGPDCPISEIGWIAASPFRPGMVWRTVRDGAPGPWSAPILPQDELLIDVDWSNPMKDHEESFLIDGIELKAKDVNGRAWTYVPLRPALETNQSGAPMLQVIEAGPTAFLQCTARVALNEDARAALLVRLKEKKPRAETLEAAPLSVERIVLEVKTGNEWVAIAESKGSGTPPWTAALAATLASDQLSALKSAVGGDRGRARLTARIVLPGSPAFFRTAEAAGEARIRTPTGEASAAFAATADTSSPGSKPTPRELTVDISDLFSQAGSHH